MVSKRYTLCIMSLYVLALVALFSLNINISYCLNQGTFSLCPCFLHFRTPSLDHTLTTTQPHLNLMSSLSDPHLRLLYFSIHSSHSLRFRQHPQPPTPKPQNPTTLPFLPHHKHPRPFPSLPNSRHLSPETPKSLISHPRSGIGHRCKNTSHGLAAPTWSQPSYARCGEGGPVARAR